MMDLATVFDAAELEDDSPPYHYQLERRTLGMLRVPSGTLVAADPFMDKKPFTRTVSPGAYPVDVLIAWVPSHYIPGKRAETCAFARVVFGPGRVQRWELAVTPGEDPTTLAHGRTFGYVVDSGTGCFADGALFTRMVDDRAVAADFDHQLRRSYPSFIHHAAEDGDLFGFTSGCGDGTYASWFGLDAQGAPVCLVTDFGLGTFVRPQANPDPARFAAAVATRVDELVCAVKAAAWTEDHDTAARDLERCNEVGDHLAGMLAVIDAETPASFVRLTWIHAGRPAGQLAFASWLRAAPPGRAAQLLDVENSGSEALDALATDRHDFAPALATALVELHRSRRVAIEPISHFLNLRASALWRGWPTMIPLVRAMLVCGTDPAVRLRGLRIADFEFAPDLGDLVPALIDDPDITVARHAATTAFRHRHAVRDLVRHLAHRDVEVRAHIALNLSGMPAWKTLFWRRQIQSTLRDAAADPSLDRLLQRSVRAALGIN